MSRPAAAAAPVRDGEAAARLTTQAVFAVSVAFGWLLFASGPVIPRLQDEYGVSRALASLHSVGLAGGQVAVALATLPLLRRFRRGGAVRLGTAVLAVAVAVVCVAPLLGRPGLALSVAAFALIGGSGVLVSTGVAALVDAHHAGRSGPVLSAVHGAGAAAGLLAPLAVGAGIAAGLSWRPGLLLHLLLAAGGLVLLARAAGDTELSAGPPPRTRPERAAPGPRLSWRFRLVLLVVMAGVAFEFAFAVWAGDLIGERTPLGPGAATAAVSGVVAGIAAGRLALARLAAGRPPGLVIGVAGVVVLAGWGLFWASTLASTGSAAGAVAGLVVAGLGIAGFFPLGTAWLMAESRGRPETALALLNVGSGVAGGSAPFVLGTVADRVGVHLAFLLVPALVAVALACLAALAATGRRAPGQGLR